MRHLIKITLLLFLFGCKGTNTENTNPKLIIRIYLIHDYYLAYHEKLNYIPENDSIKEKRFDIKMSIINNTDKMISYWTMTSNWEKSFLVNNSYIYFASHGWDHNFPDHVNINPKDSIQINATLVRDIQFDNPCKGCVGCFADQGHVQTTKIGLIFIDSSCKSAEDYDNWIRDKSKWNIIWSNPLNLRK